MAHDLFISHSSDDKAIADAVCSALETANIRCWVAPRDILPGQDWPDAIVDAIAGSRVMVLIFSSNSKNSSHVKRELTLAMEAKVIVIPLKIDDIPFEGPMRYFLTDTHWLDAMNPPTEKEIQKLVETAQALITGRKAEPIDRGIHVKDGLIEEDRIVEALPPPKKRIVAFAIAAVAIAAIAISAVVLPDLWQTGEATVTPTTEITISPTSTFSPTATPTLTPTLIPTVDVARFELLAEFSGAIAAWSPDGAMFAWANPNGSVHLLDTDKFEELMVVEGYAGENPRLYWSPDGTKLASALGCKRAGETGCENPGTCPSDTVYIWDAQTGEELAMNEYRWGTVIRAWSPDSTKFITGECAPMYDLHIWDESRPEESVVIELEKDTFCPAMAWSPDSTKLAMGSLDGSIYILDGNTGEVLTTLEVHTGSVLSLNWSQDDIFLISGTRDHLIRLWDASTWIELTSIERHTGPVGAISYSPNNTKLLSQGRTDRVRIWDARTWEELAVLEGHTQIVNSWAWSPDSTMLATGSDDGTVRVWDTSSGEELALLEEDVGFIRSVTWSPDGYLLAAGGSSYMFIWDISSWETLARFGGDGGHILAVSWSIDGKRLAAYSDYYVYIWGIPVP